MLQPAQLQNMVAEAILHSQSGQLPQYIPKLAEIDPATFALQIRDLNHWVISEGNLEITFPLMSVIKPFLFLFLLQNLGAKTVFNYVDCQPSEYPFNSLEQLQIDRGKPRNPMINSGAITLASLLPGNDPLERCQNLCHWLNVQGNCQLFLDRSILNSVYSVPNSRNHSLALELAKFGYLDDPQLAFDTYNHLCCLAGNITDLARLGLLLVAPSETILEENSCLVKAIMMTCGLYQASGRMAVKVGVPTKSGVSGILLSVIPHQGVIVSYSPRLDANGNSVAGLLLLETLAKALKLSIFN